MTISIDSLMQVRLGGADVQTVARLGSMKDHRDYALYWNAARVVAMQREGISAALLVGIASWRDSGRATAPLIGFRRSVFRRDVQQASRRFEALSAEERSMVRSSLGCHSAAVDRWMRQDALLQAEFDTRLVEQRAALCSEMSDGAVLRGLAVATPDLVEEVSRYVAGFERSGDVDKRGRRVERSMFSYLLRAAAKTTPFTWLGPVSFVDRTAPSVGVSSAGTGTSRWSIYPLSNVLLGLTRDHEVMRGVRLTISPDFRRTAQGCTIDRATWTFPGTASNVDRASCVEDSVHLPVGSLIAAVASMFDASTQTQPWRFVVEDLSRRLCVPAPRAADLVTRLLALGVLIAPSLNVEGFDEFASSQLAGGSKRGKQLAEALCRYRDDAARVTDITDPDERTAQIRSVRRSVADIYELAGTDADVPRSVVYEDVVACPTTHAFEDFELSGETVNKLLRFIDLLDTTHLRRDLLNGYYQRATCAGESVDDVGDFLRGLDDELLASFEEHSYADLPDRMLKEDPWLRWGAAWRRELVRRRLTECLGSAQESVRLETADLDALMRREPVDLWDTVRAVSTEALEIRAPFRHLNLLVQHDLRSRTTLVNDCFGGVGFTTSRFTHVVPEAKLEYLAEIEERAQKAGVSLLEVSGGRVFSNLNLHGDVLGSRLRMPGDPQRPGAHELDLRALTVRWSRSLGRALLIRRDTDKIVHPEYSGYLVPAATPRLHQALGLFTPSVNFGMKPADMLRRVPGRGHVVVRPRMELGGIVIARAAVLVNAADFPDQDPLTCSGATTWRRFWALHSIPTRAYLRVISGDTRRPKPFFFDISLLICVSNLHSRLRQVDAETVVEITEPFPDPTVASANVGSSGRVAEAMVGISIVQNSAEVR
ncbi:lantibiotic dehydratase [Curtobacterium sp. PhB78]|uniref:lantibiotic dehydratase n=1 Tax=Curtobacterium sp. PhB78 TaxID=2485102 RepID=UPI000F94CC4C|nr:lantibiotic dehydratase [Curtobacterium sp. PhB78]ROS45985.1 lantibiotic biosynthesis dehydratase-like protein [Curtobacterium sp. PhB78]